MWRIALIVDSLLRVSGNTRQDIILNGFFIYFEEGTGTF